MTMNHFAYSYLSVFLIIILITPLSYAAGPIPYIIEQARQDLYTDGSTKIPFTASGKMEIEVPNTMDVLQYIRINISDNYINNTNILTRQSFADVAASPIIGDRTPTYFDTTDGFSLAYNITNLSIVPKITLKLFYKNADGGKDLHSGTPNIMLFNITVIADTSITNAELNFKIKENTYLPDSMVLGAPQATSSTTIVNFDSDADTYDDTIYWRGDLTTDIPVYITFPATTQSGINYNPSDHFVELNEDDSLKATYTTLSTFTGITIENRLSRGPIRQGISMSFKGDTTVRGTITNKAQGLTYKLLDWALYNVTDLTNPIASGVVSSPQELLPQDSYQTPWYTTPKGSEKYYVSEFNWYVKWDPSQYQGTTITVLDLPTLYEADGIAGKSIVIVATDPTRILNIEDRAKHMGHSSIYFNSTTISSNISSGWEIKNTSVSVYYSNVSIGGSEYNITSSSVINVTATKLEIKLSDLTAMIGKPLGLNEDILVRYQVTAPSSTSPTTFVSANTFILNTSSGTPLTLSSSSSRTIPGTGLPPSPPAPGGGGSAGASTSIYFASLEKDSAEIISKENDASAQVNAVFRIMDTGSKGVGDIRSEIILPKGSTLDLESVTISTFDSIGNEHRYTSEDLIIKTAPSRINTIHYSVKLKSLDWDKDEQKLTLKDSERYSITYTAKLPFANNKLTTRLIGFNYYLDREISKDIETFIRIAKESGYLEPLEIKTSQFQSQGITVKTPPHWLKTIDVYNPNDISVQHKFAEALFPEVISTHIRSGGTEYEHQLVSGEPINVTWKDTISPREKKTYLIDVTTPPILVKDERYTIERFDETKVLFVTDIILENPASIDYENITMTYPVTKDNLLTAKENTQNLEYEQGTDGLVHIYIPSMKKKSTTTITISYLKTPPVLITTLDKDSYTKDDKVNLSILFIPEENMSYSYIQIEVLSTGEDRETIYADIKKLKDLKESTPSIFHHEFDVIDAKSGDYEVRTVASLSPFGNIEDTETFRIESSIIAVTKLSFSIILFVAIIVIVRLINRIYRRKEFEHQLLSLKKEIERI